MVGLDKDGVMEYEVPIDEMRRLLRDGADPGVARRSIVAFTRIAFPSIVPLIGVL